jgi:preprotein translocase subunit SecE
MARLQRKKSLDKKKRAADSVIPKKSKVTENRTDNVVFSGNVSKGRILSKRNSSVESKAAPGKIKSLLNKGMQFFREVKIELKKVTWPSRKQTMQFTLVVIILVMIISFFLGVIDYGLSNLIRVLLQ